jgi:hypothetical protein
MAAPILLTLLRQVVNDPKSDGAVDCPLRQEDSE